LNILGLTGKNLNPDFFHLKSYLPKFKIAIDFLSIVTKMHDCQFNIYMQMWAMQVDLIVGFLNAK